MLLVQEWRLDYRGGEIDFVFDSRPIHSALITRTRVEFSGSATQTVFAVGMWHYSSSNRTLDPQMPLPRSWIDRRRRKLRRIQREAMASIGISTSGSPAVGETTVCIAYMCPWAHSCGAATPRPALVSERQCLRKYPEEQRPDSGLSDGALDQLADQREKGKSLETVTLSMLDEFRPNGPSSSMGKKRPTRPAYDNGVTGKPFKSKKSSAEKRHLGRMIAKKRRVTRNTLKDSPGRGSRDRRPRLTQAV